jgi:dolichol-phosphate mannosyltransferase
VTARERLAAVGEREVGQVSENMHHAGRQTICIVCPCYNEAEVIGEFHEALVRAIESIEHLEAKILYVEDGSTDGTLERINELARADGRRVGVLSLSRNFGHQVSLSAGLDFAPGEAVLMMDTDMQHPPELLPEMVRLWREGKEVVSAVRKTTNDASAWQRWTSRGFYWILNRMSGTEIVDGAADFCLLSRRAADALRNMPERHRFLRGMISWVGYERAFVEFEAPARAAGRSKYTLARRIRMALDAVFSFSALPIRIAGRVGFAVTALGFGYLAYVLLWYIFGNRTISGWTSILCAVLILGGLQLAFLGLLGEYVARVFEQVKARPLYLVKQEPAWACEDAQAGRAENRA